MREVGLLSSALAALALFALVACTPTMDWREFASAEGRFSAVLPGRAHHESKPLAAAPGATLQLWSARAGESLFGVGYADLPAADEALIDKTRDAMLASVGGRLIEDRALIRNGLAGRSLVAEAGDSILSAQLLLGDGRLYQLVVLGPKSAVTPADLDLFFSSFSPYGAAADPGRVSAARRPG